MAFLLQVQSKQVRLQNMSVASICHGKPRYLLNGNVKWLELNSCCQEKKNIEGIFPFCPVSINSS